MRLWIRRALLTVLLVSILVVAFVFSKQAINSYCIGLLMLCVVIGIEYAFSNLARKTD
jgi:hypothetical protein